MNLKRNEQLFCEKKKVKGRVIVNPSDVIKLYAGYIAHLILRAYKKVSKSFVHG